MAKSRAKITPARAAARGEVSWRRAGRARSFIREVWHHRGAAHEGDAAPESTLFG
ncbi:hypothetical protein GCM10009807_31410 [Microbacterium lacus]|uniref:Uncharacterized protein n=1 Tax=Microbacterium lacus TaxID=415217 RepID=A0ABP4TBB1_9MICO